MGDMLDKILEAKRMLGLPPREPSLFDSLKMPSSLMGMKVYERQPVPRLQVRDIKLSDGTSILTPEFRAEMNAWLVAQFGVYDPFGDNVYVFGGNGISLTPKHMALIANVTA